MYMYLPEIALTYVYLFCREPPKIFLMIRLPYRLQYPSLPPLPELDMGVGERFIIIRAGIC